MNRITGSYIIKEAEKAAKEMTPENASKTLRNLNKKLIPLALNPSMKSAQFSKKQNYKENNIQDTQGKLSKFKIPATSKKQSKGPYNKATNFRGYTAGGNFLGGNILNPNAGIF